MINFYDYTNQNKTEHNLKWPHIPDHPYRILIIGGSGSGKTNALLNLINNQPDINKIYLYAKDPYEAKYQHLINKREKVGIEHFSIMKIPNKRELQQIALNLSSDVEFKDFIKIYQKRTAEPYSFLVNDTTLSSDDPIRFRKNLL